MKADVESLTALGTRHRAGWLARVGGCPAAWRHLLRVAKLGFLEPRGGLNQSEMGDAHRGEDDQCQDTDN
jgi:hypothetical protein